jgi:hypothetical protein
VGSGGGAFVTIGGGRAESTRPISMRSTFASFSRLFPAVRCYNQSLPTR